jgi:hypothetical protein
VRMVGERRSPGVQHGGVRWTPKARQPEPLVKV